MEECSMKGKKIVTQIAPLGKWYDGEAYHQEYRESRRFLALSFR